MTLHNGDRVQIEFDGQRAEGVVRLAADNGASLLLQFEAILGGYVGMMAVLDAGEGYHDLIRGLPVQIASCNV